MTTTPTSGAADLPKAQYPAAERDELLQVAIDFIGTLTGMKPPPIEVAPPEVFAPFRAFVDQVQSVTSRYAALAAGQATAAQAVVPTNPRLCYSCGHPADAHPWVNDPRGGKRRGDCPAAPAQPAAQQAHYEEQPDGTVIPVDPSEMTPQPGLAYAVKFTDAHASYVDRYGGNCRDCADEVVSLLVEALPGLSVSLLHTQTSPQTAMAHWLSGGADDLYEMHSFTVDRECELKAADETKAVVKYGRHPLDIDEVQQHIAQGKLPTKLALTWDDRVSFVLTEGLQVRKLQFLDTVFEGSASEAGGFDADVAIATGELYKLIPDLVEALGGEAAS